MNPKVFIEEIDKIWWKIKISVTSVLHEADEMSENCGSS